MRIGLDTNILLRLLTQDDPTQGAQAQRIVAEQCSPDAPGYVNRIVLCELVWTLQRGYKFDRLHIVGALEALLETADLEIEDSALAWSALEAYREGADFSDALIARVNAARGCSATVSFDKAAVRNAGMTSP